MEQMDASDLGFKPCPCGYQVRRRARRARPDASLTPCAPAPADLRLLLAPHQAEPQRPLSCLPSRVLGRRGRVHKDPSGRVRQQLCEARFQNTHLFSQGQALESAEEGKGARAQRHRVTRPQASPQRPHSTTEPGLRRRPGSATRKGGGTNHPGTPLVNSTDPRSSYHLCGPTSTLGSTARFQRSCSSSGTNPALVRRSWAFMSHTTDAKTPRALFKPWTELHLQEAAARSCAPATGRPNIA